MPSEKLRLYNKKYRKIRYEERKAAGICIFCDSLARPNRVTCHDHRKAHGTPEKRWIRQLWRLYKITPEEYFNLLEKQDGVCAICKKPALVDLEKPYAPKGRLCVDHDHDTEKIRGLLCTTCNQGLGLLGDTIESIQIALDYLRKTA